MVTTIKMQARGVLTLPKKLRTRMKFEAGTIVNVQEKNGGIFIMPSSRLDADLLKDVYSALEEIRTGRTGPRFSSGKELHAYMQKKYPKARTR